MATLEELVVKISADTSQITQQLNQLQQTVSTKTNTMKSAVGGLAAEFRSLLPTISAIAALNFVKTAFGEADRINDLAQRVGFLGSTLSALNIPLKQSGSSLEEFTSSMVRMNNAIGESSSNASSPLLKTFNELGLSVKKLEQMAPEQQFFEIAAALANVKDQATFTRLGIDVFGRSFATIAPLIRSTNGELEQFVQKQKDSGNALTDDDLKRIDEFGDKWVEAVSQIKLAVVELLPFLEKFIEGMEWLRKQNPMTSLASVGIEIGARAGYIDRDVADEALGIGGEMRQGKNPLKITVPNTKGGAGSGTGNAKGGNTIEDKQLESARKALQDYIKDLKEQNNVLRLTPREQAAVTAGYKAQELAMKAKIKLGPEEIAQIENIARANYDLNEAMQEQVRYSQELKDKFSDALTDIAFDFDNAADAAQAFGEQIAKMILQRQIMGPMMDSMFGTSSGGGGFIGDLFGGSGSLLSGLGFAEGGRPPVGKASWVGENGPELWVPDGPGTIIPNRGDGGGKIILNQTFNISPGLQGAVRAELMASIPSIVAASKEAVFGAIQRGGPEARMVNRRN